MKNTKLPDNPSELEDIIVLGEIEVEFDHRRPDRVYTNEMIKSIIDKLPMHGILLIVEDDGTEQEE